jgi:hypothetical protein
MSAIDISGTISASCTSLGRRRRTMMMMNVQQLVERQLAEKSEVFGEKLPHCQFIHNKSHVK